jgi:hypothetical protein
LSFGFQSVAREDGKTVANLLKGLIDEASTISSSTQNDSKSGTLLKMLNLLAILMSRFLNIIQDPLCLVKLL